MKTTVHVCIWEVRGNNPTVFLARTEKKLGKAIWAVIKDYWDKNVGDEKPPKNLDAAITRYAQACLDHETGEYFTYYKETLE